MDRCALFVDAGYVLADGAMAVHGTRHRESVSWDYAGLTQFLAGLASGHFDKTLLFDADTGQKVRVLKGHTGAVNSVCVSPDGKHLAMRGWNVESNVWLMENF